MLDEPGKLKSLATYINTESNEQKLSTYISFNDVAHARTLILSWPVLKAIKSFEPIARHMNKKKAFKLLDAESLFQDVDLLEKWPIRSKDSKAEELPI